MLENIRRKCKANRFMGVVSPKVCMSICLSLSHLLRVSSPCPQDRGHNCWKGTTSMQRTCWKLYLDLLIFFLVKKKGWDQLITFSTIGGGVYDPQQRQLNWKALGQTEKSWSYKETYSITRSFQAGFQHLFSLVLGWRLKHMGFQQDHFFKSVAWIPHQPVPSCAQ